jgi:hypothetical protein
MVELSISCLLDIKMLIADGGGAGRNVSSSPPRAAAPAPPPPPPKRVAEAPAGPSSGSPRNAPSSAPQNRERLAEAAQNTQQKVTTAAIANNNVAQLEQLPFQQRRQLQGEIRTAQGDANRASADAHVAVHEELGVAKEILSPAYYDDYTSALGRDFADNSDEALIVREAIENRDVTTTEATQPTDPALAEIEAKQEELQRAETRYAETARSVETAPPHVKDLTLPPLLENIETKRAELAQLIEADLTTAAQQPMRYPNDDQLASRAQQIADISGNTKFDELVTTVQQQVTDTRATDAAVASVENTYATEGAVAASEEIAAQAAWMTPSQAAMLVERIDGTIDDIAVDLGKSNQDAQPEVNKAIAALSAAAEKGGAESVAQISESLVNGFSDEDIGAYPTSTHGNPDIPKFSRLHDALSTAIENGSGASLAVATAQELRDTGRVDAANKIDQAIVSGVDKLRENFNEIQTSYAQREIQLQKELADFGPGLTAEQRTAYTEAYWADDSIVPAGDQGDLASNADIRSQFAASDDQLAAALTATTPTLERMALAGDENAGEVLLDSYESLARTPAYAEQSIEWMQNVEGNSALFEKLDGFVDDDLSTRFSDGIKANGLESMASQLLVDLSYADEGERQGLIDDFLAKARLLDSSGGYLDDIEKIGEFNKDWQEFNRLRALPADHPDRVKLTNLESKLAANAEELVDGWESGDKFGKSLAVVGLVVGLTDTVNSFANGDIPEGVLAAIGTGKDAGEIGIGILGVVGKGGRVAGLDAANFGTDAARVAGIAGKAADFGARFLPLVGLGLDAVQAWDDIDQLRTNPNFGEAIALVGTTVSLVGDVAEIVPILGTVVGGVLGAAGSLIHGVGGFIDGLFEGSEERDALNARQRSNLEAAGLDEATAAAFVDAPYEIALLDNLDLQPEQIQLLVTQLAADGANDGYRMTAFRSLSGTAAAYGMTGDAAASLINEAFTMPLDQAIEVWGNPPGLYGHTTTIENDWEAQETKRQAAEWLQETLPDVFARHFSGYQTFPALNEGYFSDFIELNTSSDPNIAGKDR